MFYESDASSDTSYPDHSELGGLVNRCSICFDAKLDLCIEECRDQFCLDCFQKYITGVVQSSWGLSVTVIKCPVCNECIPKHEWSRYVSSRVVSMYDMFNKPFKSYSRSCPDCDTELVPCTHQYDPNITRSISDLLDRMIYQCPDQEEHKDHTEHIAIKRWIPIYKRQHISDSQLLSFYQRMMDDILLFESNHTMHTIYTINTYRYSYMISTQFLNMCVKPDIWKQLQFAHISYFPKMNCVSCQNAVCLHCGYPMHYHLTCEDNMKGLLHSKIDKETKATLQWKLDNSRPCPSCSIMINRDEGCNKVDCLYCGHSYCWLCLSPWKEGCGFYRCTIQSNKSYDVHKDKVELGIPDIKNIQERLISRR
ncbi:hypothetical protein BDB01DRAFT_307712 [Pilobolus umbonatus]|nr:hypothetical protein BDB01DRAFT_307712 [Pilobolus umbonatus]